MFLYRIKELAAVERCGNFTSDIGFIAAESEEDVCEKFAAHLGYDLDESYEYWSHELQDEVETTYRELFLKHKGQIGCEWMYDDPEDVVFVRGWELIGEITPEELAVLEKFGAILKPRVSA